MIRVQRVQRVQRIQVYRYTYTLVRQLPSLVVSGTYQWTNRVNKYNKNSHIWTLVKNPHQNLH